MIAVARPDDPNFQILQLAAKTLGDLCDSLVFVGGCATGLLVTATRAQAIRATQDVDVVVAVATVHEYHAVEKRVAEKGFAHDTSAGAPICRWIKQGLKLDLMPSDSRILGFNNRWYPLAIETAEPVDLGAGLAIKLVPPAVFLGTKLEAFRDRGRGDFLASHDLEDVVTVIDGRAELIDEARKAPDDLRTYIGTEIQKLLDTTDFLDALPGHLPGDGASQARVPEIMRRLRLLAAVQRAK